MRETRIHPGVSPAAPRPYHGKIVWDSYAHIPGGVCNSKSLKTIFFPKNTNACSKKTFDIYSWNLRRKAFFSIIVWFWADFNGRRGDLWWGDRNSFVSLKMGNNTALGRLSPAEPRLFINGQITGRRSWVYRSQSKMNHPVRTYTGPRTLYLVRIKYMCMRVLTRLDLFTYMYYIPRGFSCVTCGSCILLLLLCSTIPISYNNAIVYDDCVLCTAVVLETAERQ